MRPPPILLDPPGEVAPLGSLVISKARDFARFLEQVGPRVFARLKEVRKQRDPSAEVVVFSVEVERPQHLAHDIRRHEDLAAVFRPDDEKQPEVLALRSDFPSVPHINLAATEFPRSLCLYEQPYEEVRLNWTPAQFLNRIRYWLAKTAAGSLHADDQPLEPLIPASGSRLILPADFDTSDVHQKPRLLNIQIVSKKDDDFVFVASWREGQEATKIGSIAAAFSCQPQTHGVIRRQPANLKELHDLCSKAGLDLVNALATKIQEWHVEKPAADVLKSHLVLIILLPKTRREGTVVESVETRAFFTMTSVEDVAIHLGVIQRHCGAAGYVIGERNIDIDRLTSVPVGILQVHSALSPTSASAMNGTDSCEKRILGIGMGALGSQVFNNLCRAGFGRWTLVDPDILLPHNCARHCLGQWAVGQNKAQAMADLANAILDGPAVAKAIPVDVLKPGQNPQDFNRAYADAETVCDFSASVAVARHLASTTSTVRHLSAYLSPRGDCLVVAAEDSERAIRLDWLEMLHYRAVLCEDALADTLRSHDSHLRYGNGCRDVSTRLAQDDTAMWSGIASKAIKRVFEDARSSLQIYVTRADGSVDVLRPEIGPLIGIRWPDWTIRLDRWLIEKVGSIRNLKLPNETGGVLLGHFDTHHRVCSLVDVLLSPKDSSEWPTSYIRGCAGLRQSVERVQEQTLGQIGYVGEWHSHPARCSTHPSPDDLTAYGWLAEHMHAEALPALMLIAGDNGQFQLVAYEP